MATASRPSLPPRPRAQPRLLVVEDSAFIVMALESVCAALGWAMVGPAASLRHGLALAEAGGQDAALLDVSLGQDWAWPIATLLQAQGTPFAFATGHDLSAALPAEFAGVPVLRKPYRHSQLEAALTAMLAQRPRAELPA
ncbi:response regulator [Sandarakinorhabdus oryzae]|uniref:response regulator n=1 Tax=Sandarakinorhabdus oryzae TaxID=2675220 RepID=UPI0012E31542|nr:response regulator [Sandarakinorhabdus oryzae]